MKKKLTNGFEELMKFTVSLESGAKLLNLLFSEAG